MGNHNGCCQGTNDEKNEIETPLKMEAFDEEEAQKDTMKALQEKQVSSFRQPPGKTGEKNKLRASVNSLRTSKDFTRQRADQEPDTTRNQDAVTEVLSGSQYQSLTSRD